FVDHWDYVGYTLQKVAGLLMKGNPNVASLLYLRPEHYLYLTGEGAELVANRDLFVSKQAHFAFTGYAKAQLDKMQSYTKKGYMGQKRAALVEKFGYDCKNAAHLIRLLRMEIEFLKDGMYHVYREQDRDELISIKKGAWTIEQVKEAAADLFAEAEEAFEKSELPDTCDQKAVNSLLVDLSKSYHG